MTKQEARNLKVGDLVIFYDYVNQEIIKGHTFFYEVVEGKDFPADLGLIVNTAPDEVEIDWFSEPFSRLQTFHYDDWEQIEKYD
jgi:hypothetical protein